MSAPAHLVRYTWREYLALERASNVRHEYFDGQIFAMAAADLRVRVLATGLATYPDVSVVRGSRELDADGALSVTNPTLLAEVLSASTETYDRGEKFAHYKRIPSLRQYVLVSQEEHLVEVWTRAPDDTWTSAVLRDGDVADLGSLGATLDVRALYEAATEGAG